MPSMQAKPLSKYQAERKARVDLLCEMIEAMRASQTDPDVLEVGEEDEVCYYCEGVQPWGCPECTEELPPNAVEPIENGFCRHNIEPRYCEMCKAGPASNSPHADYPRSHNPRLPINDEDIIHKAWCYLQSRYNWQHHCDLMMYATPSRDERGKRIMVDAADREKPWCSCYLATPIIKKYDLLEIN